MCSTASIPCKQSASWAAHPEPLLLPTFPAGKLCGVTGALPAGPTVSARSGHALWTFPGCITEQVPFAFPAPIWCFPNVPGLCCMLCTHTEIPVRLRVPLGKGCLQNCGKQLRDEWVCASPRLVTHSLPAMLAPKHLSCKCTTCLTEEERWFLRKQLT